MNKKSAVGSLIAALSCTAIILFWCSGISAAGENVKMYVGSDACKDCHDTEFSNFKAYTRKARSFSSIEVMKKGLTEAELKGCFQCHTTGYGEPGGFISEDKTPKLKNAGCEVCHGPGSVHCETEDAADIKGKLSMADCEECHNAERVGAFKFKPLVYGGAH